MGGDEMSVLGYFGRDAAVRVEREVKTDVERVVRPVVAALRRTVEVAGPGGSYKKVEDYEPVLKGHCRL
jgi:hypothetical protein